MVKGRKKVEMNSRIKKEKPGKPQVLSVSARQDLNLRPLRPEGLGENGRAWHTVQTVIIRTFISFHIDYSIGYSYFKPKR